MRGRRGFIVASVGACAAALLPRPLVAQDQADDASRLRRLLDESDEALLDRNPIYALYRGDTRRAASHGDFLSAAYVDAERRAAEAELARLAEIRRERLEASDRIAYDVFRWSREQAREHHTPPAASIWPMLTVNQINGWHAHFAELSSGSGVAPYKTVADYDNGLSRVDGFLGWLERATARMREGLRSGVVLPRIIVERVIAQFDAFAAQGLDDSPYYGPVRRMPAAIGEPDRTRLTKAYAAAVEERLRPAFRRMAAFLRDDYLPSARSTVAISELPGGPAYYAYLIRSHTTTALDAGEVHRLGLAEVARIRAGMTAAMRKASFDGSLAQFFDHLRTDRRFEPKSAEEVAEGYAAIGRRVDAALPRLFASLPKTPLAIRPTPSTQAVHDAAARYNDGSLESGQPAVFYFNTHDLPSRKLWHMETLYLHEALPGHHLQSATAAENTVLPKLLRFDGNTAYNEGWGALCREPRPGAGPVRRPLPAVRPLQRRDAAGDAPRRRQRPACARLVARAGDRLHARELGDDPGRRHRRGRALHRQPRPGARLQGRRPDHPAPALAGRGGAEVALRRARVPPPGAGHRQHPDGGPRGKDRGVDRGRPPRRLNAQRSPRNCSVAFQVSGELRMPRCVLSRKGS